MTWSSLDLAQHCLSDRERTDALIGAINEIVAPGMDVVDAGSGSGILGLAALAAGASSLVAIEQDEIAAAILKRSMMPHDNATVIAGDATEADFANKVDVMIAELIDVWLLEEDQFNLLSALDKRGLLGPDTVLFPCGYTWMIEFGSIDGNQFPHGISMPHYEWPHYALDPERWNLPTFRGLGRQELATESFADLATGPAGREFSVGLDPSEVGSIDAVRLSGDLHLTSTTTMGATSSLNAPVVIPLTRRPSPNAGPLQIAFDLSGGLGSLKVADRDGSYLAW